MKIYKHFSFNAVENYTYKSHKIFRVVFKYQYLSIFEENIKYIVTEITLWPITCLLLLLSFYLLSSVCQWVNLNTTKLEVVNFLYMWT